jgi:2'-5' RNA ligase
LPKRSTSLDLPSAPPSRVADADTRERHERIWQEFLQRPAIFVYEPRFLRIPGVVAMLTVQARITDRSIRRRLRRVVENLGEASCIEPYPEDYFHMTVVPPALLTTGERRPPLLLPDGFEIEALGTMREVLRDYGPFEVQIQGLNVFRDVLVAVALDGGHSAEIRRRLASVVPELPDKYWNALPAVPHISLAQFTNAESVTQLRDAVASLRDVYLGTLHVTRLYVVRSPLVEGVFGESERRAIPLVGSARGELVEP